MASFRDYVRLCKTYDNCDFCPLSQFKDNYINCSIGSIEDENKVEAIIDKWVEEHPTKTYADDFFEKFPNAPKNKDGIPRMCMNEIYQTIQTCDGDCKFCWNLEYKE